ncbi:lasso peptide biosynthesis B2 protein [Streptomyces sp. NPDC055966]|uniref:lasso peptide biosynthesis B2 protein n=1 Tax=Streptomyces sp. NPDC055966 TaxID=3345669 RepID=UPI0035DA4DA4
MSSPGALYRPGPVPWRLRAVARIAVVLARALVLLPPRRIRSLLGAVRHGARPATYAQASDARNAVLAVSLRCSGPKGCLPRSLATVLVCRARGTWPSWCVGVRALPPPAAHAWVEAQGRPVDEQVPAEYFRALFTVPPVVSEDPADGLVDVVSDRSQLPAE